jgi:predicted transcriptional regulator of viral defense system
VQSRLRSTEAVFSCAIKCLSTDILSHMGSNPHIFIDRKRWERWYESSNPHVFRRLKRWFVVTETAIDRVVQLVRKIGVACNRDFKSAGLHQQFVARACSRGMIEKIGRGTYVLPGREETPQQRLVEACKRVPQGALCLFSALWFHGLIPEEPEAVWMAIDKKARTPQVDSLPLKFVFSSGDALTQGVVTLGLIDEVQVRVYSPMKTVADCFKYADKIGVDVGPAALAASVASNKYNRQRLLRFAEICRVKQAVAAAEKARRRPIPLELPEGEEAPKPDRIWDRDLLEKQVWSEPIRLLAARYGVSDVAIHKHCKKMGIKLPGRGYWAKKASQKEPPSGPV